VRLPTIAAFVAALAVVLGTFAPGVATATATAVRRIEISYRAHDGLMRRAYVLLPAWYGPRSHPPIPFVISPHGRGVSAQENIRRWGHLSAVGDFAVINPEGQGRALTLYSWGDPGEIRDLARMPEIAEHALPWLRVDRHRVYAFGGSMGGQETLLLLARFPRVLAGAAAFDAPTNMAARYRAFVHLPLGVGLQRLARAEIGGTPATDPRGYARRSPFDWAHKIAFSGVPLQIWWSTRDRIVTDERDQSGLLYRVVKRLNPRAPVTEFVGDWAHTTEMKAHGYLPYALSRFGLIPPRPGPPAGGSLRRLDRQRITPGVLRLVAEQLARLVDRKQCVVLPGGHAVRDGGIDLGHQLVTGPVHDRVSGCDDEVLGADVLLQREPAAQGDVPHVDVAPQVPAAKARVVPVRREPLVVRWLHDVREPQRHMRLLSPAVQLPAELLGQELRQRITGLRIGRMLLVDRGVRWLLAFERQS
jgi:dienelactone hydrolase